MSMRVNKTGFQKQVLESKVPVLVEFYSDGCLGCKQFSPVLGEMEEVYEEQIKIVKVNAMFEQELAEKYHISMFPTILFFKNGENTDRLEGIVPRQELENIIHKQVSF